MVLYIGLFALTATIALGFWVGFYEKKRESIPYWNTMVSLFITVMVIAGLTLIPWVTIAASVDDIVEDNVAEYEELMIYKHTVEESSNEYLRWNYYEKVEQWNERYEANEELKQNPSFWFSCYQYDYFVGTSYIDFQLHGDELPEG